MKAVQVVPTSIKELLLSSLVLNIVVCLVAFYLAYHSVHGQRGILAYLSVSRDLDNKRIVLAQLLSNKKAMENRVSLVNSGDSDIIDELLRKKAGLARQGETVVILKDLEAIKKGN
ncbi:FtsB family cell division protein [Rickettsiales endosymbiont of Peranema trichophorum]|uniref:FtsB family cell division protein n=1 Tax=Rickettsiales endosymbiont of Peranema trichophorum TaxID=2486577 RepID=UPI0013EE9211|nr:septum formation initiator family protein [Rickettsiales endosymbiont of Peranema trichophorum]